jgi:pimeloyl-ACP methyl ester carboxylesterase
LSNSRPRRAATALQAINREPAMDSKPTKTPRVADTRAPITYPSEKRTEAANDIRPFTYRAPDEALTDLRRRILATRWPEKETVADDSQGVPLAPLQDLARYWATEYDWRKAEARLNALPQFTTEIDGLDIHFIHVRSKHENALPVIITHGWPGSIIEELKIIDPLVDPTAHGGRVSDAFHVVIPSMPGYGFSGKPTTSGWDPARIGRAWVTLMQRLGYAEFVAQGTDWGAIIVDVMATQAPPGLRGIHTNMAGVLPADVWRAVVTGGPPPSGLSDEETRTYERLKTFFAKGVAYALEMGTRPQTLYGLADSPVFLAAWLLDHGDGNAQPTASWMKAIRNPMDRDGDTELTRDDVLDNITLYWLTNTGVSSGRLYWENKLPFFGAKNVTIPVAVSVFPGEFYQAPRSWAERAYPKLIHYNRLDKGGHFAAWEQPELFAAEMRAGLKSLR